MMNLKINKITTNSSDESAVDKVYNLHKYWSRKPWGAIHQCIERYSKPNDLVVDLFLGSGVTALESIILGRQFIGYDLNPIAIDISKNTISTSFNLEIFDKELDVISDRIRGIAKSIYASSEACNNCGSNLTIQHLNVGPKFSGCETAYLFCEACGKSKSRLKVPLNHEDRHNYEKSYPIEKWVPNTKFPERFYKDRFSYKGIRHVTDMFSNRNLYFLSELLDTIRTSDLDHRDLFFLAFSNTLLHGTKLKSENVRPLGVNNYWVPDDYIEENVWLRFLDRVKKIRTAKLALKDRVGKQTLGQAQIFNSSSLQTKITSDSVDYIITDPPYGDAIQYSELSFIWNSWAGKIYDTEDEVIVNPLQNKKVGNFISFIDKSVCEASRILKENSFYTLCFHNKDLGIWRDVLNCFKRYNFSLCAIEVVQGKGSSYNVNWSTFSPKTDLYLTFMKSEFSYNRHFPYSIEDLLNQVIDQSPMANNDEIYDALVIRLIEETFYNSYDPAVSSFNIKKIVSMISRVQSSK